MAMTVVIKIIRDTIKEACGYLRAIEWKAEFTCRYFHMSLLEIC